MSLTPFVTGNELIRCGCCKEFIPERVDRELGQLVYESCWKGLRNGKAWLVAAGMPKITFGGDER